jgi:PTH1 family peptidyl-tRNA hydrolase
MIIIGLGNPGEKYNKTRHNIGFEIIDQLKEENQFPDFKLSKKFNALISEKNDIILVKPQTFMNLSGKAVRAITTFYKTKEFIIIHDDIDLVIGKIKISKNRGAGGHKGIESIIREIGKDFTRVRIGIQPEKGKPINVEKFVLQKFEKKELEEIKKSLANQPSFC